MDALDHVVEVEVETVEVEVERLDPLEILILIEEDDDLYIEVLI